MSLDFRTDGRDWPLRAASRFVLRGSIRWHVQVAGRGPVVLLIHGTGASSHSFRALIPRLAADCTVIAPDLPGQGFSRAPLSFEPTLPGTAAAVAELMDELGAGGPEVIVGHSAGAAVAVQMALDGVVAAPRSVVGLAAALVPLRGVPGVWFAPAARWLSRSGLAAGIIAAVGARDRASVDRLLRRTGSALDAEGVSLYWKLARDRDHVAAVLAMLSRWDLRPLWAALPALRTRLVLVAGERDRAVPLEQQREIAARAGRAAGGAVRVVRGAGHLVHEERADEVARIIRAEAGA